ncbi:hypothetical protein [Luteimonas sp. MC1825]|uniref:hypothetical protein n=1 Tax=Luteimonas sp. MC1825 TaxID=2761107 RepID=UPI00160A0F42|nr:hypothetical protein [Luteimonas sp. MC1825]MBB6598188.1 hypothetical protein [Luteimonas sp. MC1825]QOC88413.1 hypothetical protein IDM46_01165 [Luteimonas sp. MC1825]
MRLHRHATVLASILALSFAAGAAHARQDVDKVNGSISVAAGEVRGNLETVNGSIRIGENAQAGAAGTVNGSVHVGNDGSARSLETVNGSIRLGERVRIEGDVETVNGSVFAGRGSRIGGNVENVNGALGLVQTEVAGNVETVNGDVTVGVGSHVRGQLRVHKPTANWMPVRVRQRAQRIVIGPGVVIDGDLVFEREVQLYVHDTARIGTITGATAIPFSTPTAPARQPD